MSENKKLVPKEEEIKAVVASDSSIYFDVAKFEHAQRVAKMFAESTMVPEHFAKNVGNCLIVLNLAGRTQCDPFMLMQNMYIIKGKPGMEAKLAIALVNNMGKFTPLQYKYNDGKTACIAYAKSTETGELCEGPQVTLEMAKAEGWMSKPGSKWKTMPELMLTYRAAMFFARLFCPEALFGMKTREELHDITPMVQGENGTFIEAPTTEELTEQLKAPPEQKKATRPRKASKPKPEGKDTPKEEKDPPGASGQGEQRPIGVVSGDDLPPDETKVRYLMQERQVLIKGMKAYPTNVQFQAKKSYSLPVSESVWPPTLEGCNFLSDKMQEIHENKGE